MLRVDTKPCMGCGYVPLNDLATSEMGHKAVWVGHLIDATNQADPQPIFLTPGALTFVCQRCGCQWQWRGEEQT